MCINNKRQKPAKIRRDVRGGGEFENNENLEVSGFERTENKEVCLNTFFLHSLTINRGCIFFKFFYGFFMFTDKNIQPCIFSNLIAI